MINPTKPALIAASLDTPPGVDFLELRKPIVFKTPAHLAALAALLGTSGSGIQAWDISFAASDETTPLTNGTAKATLRATRSMTVTEVRASLTTAGSGDVDICVKVNGVEILGGSHNTRVPFAFKTSLEYGFNPAVENAAIEADDEITVDIVAHGNTAAGLKVYLIGNLEAEVISPVCDISFAASDEITPLTNGTAKATLRATRAMTVTEVRASLTTPGTGDVDICVKVNGVAILAGSHNTRVPFAFKTSLEYGFNPAVENAAIEADDEITVDIVAHGNTAAGLKVYLLGNL